MLMSPFKHLNSISKRFFLLKEFLEFHEYRSTLHIQLHAMVLFLLTFISEEETERNAKYPRFLFMRVICKENNIKECNFYWAHFFS